MDCVANCVCDPDCLAIGDGDGDVDGEPAAGAAEPNGAEDDEEGEPWVAPDAADGGVGAWDGDAGTGVAGDLCLAECAADEDCLGPCGEGNVCADVQGVRVCMSSELVDRMGW